GGAQAIAPLREALELEAAAGVGDVLRDAAQAPRRHVVAAAAELGAGEHLRAGERLALPVDDDAGDPAVDVELAAQGPLLGLGAEVDRHGVRRGALAAGDDLDAPARQPGDVEGPLVVGVGLARGVDAEAGVLDGDAHGGGGDRRAVALDDVAGDVRASLERD